jgi:hypothetical protein
VVNVEQTGTLGLPIVIMDVSGETRFMVPLSDEQPKNEREKSEFETSCDFRVTIFDP